MKKKVFAYVVFTLFEHKLLLYDCNKNCQNNYFPRNAVNFSLEGGSVRTLKIPPDHYSKRRLNQEGIWINVLEEQEEGSRSIKQILPRKSMILIRCNKLHVDIDESAGINRSRNSSIRILRKLRNFFLELLLRYLLECRPVFLTILLPFPYSFHVIFF